VFGSAVHEGRFDPEHSDIDFLVTFASASRDDLAVFADFKDALERLLGRSVDLIEREAVEQSRNSIRRRRILSEAKSSMAELPERDAALLLDMLLAAKDARDFIANMDQVRFWKAGCTRMQSSGRWRSSAKPRGRFRRRRRRYLWMYLGAIWPACAIV
jgi:uncharacterized protein